MSLLKKLLGIKCDCASCKDGRYVIKEAVGSAETLKCDNCKSEVTVYLNTATGKRSNE